MDASVQSETHVFHNGSYGYKNWGIGLAAHASYHENPRSPTILQALEQDCRPRAAPGLELAGDGGGRVFGGERDKALSARRILVNHFRDDPAHQAVHAFNEGTPRSSVGNFAYMDFLWRDPTVTRGELSRFKLSHFSPGAGHVYARSSWREDATRAYSTNKLKCFTRQIVFLRPGTFVLFDRVTSTEPEFKKTWLLQAMKTPERHGEDWVVTNGQGRLFVQTVLPESHRTSVAKGEELYRYDGQVFPPRRDTGPAPECRLEISPAQSNATDLFLHVLTATDASVDAVPRAAVEMQGNRLHVTVADVKLSFGTDSVGGDITWRGPPAKLAEPVPSGELPAR